MEGEPHTKPIRHVKSHTYGVAERLGNGWGYGSISTVGQPKQSAGTHDREGSHEKHIRTFHFTRGGRHNGNLRRLRRITHIAGFAGSATLAVPELAANAGNPVVLSARGMPRTASTTVDQGTGRRTFTFNALERADGSISGQIQVHNRAGAGNGLHGEIICMNDWEEGIVVLAAQVTTYGTYLEGQIPTSPEAMGSLRSVTTVRVQQPSRTSSPRWISPT